MNIIKQDIESRKFHNVYLFYGEEEYLKLLYREKLKTAVLGEDNDINFSVFSGDSIVVNDVIEACDTAPFFSDYRFVLIEDSGWMSSAGTFEEYLKNLPETTIILFVERKADKRTKLFKYVSSKGHVCDFATYTEEDRKMFVASRLKKAGKSIKSETLSYFMQKVGNDMFALRNETEKVICYTGDREIVSKEDIDAICSENITDRIFDMIDAKGAGDIKKAIDLYFDLLSLRESPAYILYMFIRHFRILFLVNDLVSRGADNSNIASSAGVPPFLVKKYISQAKRFTKKNLLDFYEYGVTLDSDFKSGNLSEDIIAELFLLKNF